MQNWIIASLIAKAITNQSYEVGGWARPHAYRCIVLKNNGLILDHKSLAFVLDIFEFFRLVSKI